MSDLGRFMNFVLVGPETRCWWWLGATFKKSHGDYGCFQLATGKSGGRAVQAHRWAYENFSGPIPKGHVIDHKCRNKLCVNPAHLRAVTHRVNVLENNDSVCSINAKKTHCKRGHEFNEKNTKLVPGGRECRECRRLRKKGLL